MNSKHWKNIERTIANFFKTKRTPLSGSNSRHNTSSDSLHEDFYIEVKYRKETATGNLFKDTKQKAKKENKVPIVCTKDKNKNGFLITVHSDDLERFIKLHGEQK